MLKKLLYYLKNPGFILLRLDDMHLITLNDKLFLKLLYRERMGKKLNLKNPQTFNEKLQWLKLYDRKDIYTTMVDKYEAKKYVANIIGEEYVIPTLGIYDNFEDIDFDKLPNKFVIKTTHDSNSICICNDKKKFDIEKTRKKINEALKVKYYYLGREWPYKNVKPRIIIEKYMEDKETKELRDYKIYSFNGKCDYVMACFDRFINKPKFFYFDKNWKIKKEFSKDGLKYGDIVTIKKPVNLDKMFKFAKILSKNIPFVRVDFYEVDGKLFFGELTFFPSAGFDDTRTEECSTYLNEMLDIRK